MRASCSVIAGLAVLFGLVMAGHAGAAVTRYECAFPTGGVRDGNWVPSIVVLQHDDETGNAVVFDPIIRNFVGKPITGRLVEATRARSTFGWDVIVSSGRASGVTMSYRLSYFVNGVPARMTVLPQGYDNRFSAEGTCKLSRR